MRKWFPLLLALALCLVCTAAMAETTECAHEKTTLMPDPNAWGGHVWLCDACGEIVNSGGCEFEYVLVDADTHMEVCKVCGCETTPQQHGPYVCEANGANHDVLCYVCNGKVATSPLKYIAIGDYTNMQHQAQCDYCLQSINYTPKTEACTPVGVYVDENSCTYICTTCGHDWAGGHHFVLPYGNGNGTHDVVCTHCGYAIEDDQTCFESSCANYDGKCDACGSANPVDFYHEDAAECTPNGDGTHSILCTTCGTDLNGAPQKCFDLCTDADGKCDFCGTEGAPIKHYYNENYVCEDCGDVACPHENLTCTDKGDIHTVTCADCGEVIADYPEEATASGWLEHGTGCGVCAMNGKLVIEPCTLVYKSTSDSCSYICTVCGHDWSAWNGGEHSFEYTAANADHTAKCITCGYAVTEAHVYTDDEDNDCDVCGKQKQCEHTHWYKVPKAATCTEDGIRVNYCNLCGKEHSTQSIPAKGHDLTSKDMGDYILESCSRCDYENKIEKQAEQPVEQTEQAAEAAPVTDGLQVTDVDMEAETAIQLPENVSAAKVFSVAYMEDGEAVQPEAAMTVMLALTEEDLSAVEGLKLMLILEDGTMVEVPYEVIDGQIVFTAEQLGTFAFVAE